LRIWETPHVRARGVSSSRRHPWVSRWTARIVCSFCSRRPCIDDAGPARRSALPMASRYEIALRVTTELVVLELRRMARTDFGAMRRRHANIQ
jgi:hypothetical protein